MPEDLHALLIGLLGTALYDLVRWTIDRVRKLYRRKPCSRFDSVGPRGRPISKNPRETDGGRVPARGPVPRHH